MAYVYTGLGEPDRAMDLLERAYEERAGSVYGIKGSFLFTALHSHPRFTAAKKDEPGLMFKRGIGRVCHGGQAESRKPGR